MEINSKIGINNENIKETVTKISKENDIDFLFETPEVFEDDIFKNDKSYADKLTDNLNAFVKQAKEGFAFITSVKCANDEEEKIFKELIQTKFKNLKYVKNGANFDVMLNDKKEKGPEAVRSAMEKYVEITNSANMDIGMKAKICGENKVLEESLIGKTIVTFDDEGNVLNREVTLNIGGFRLQAGKYGNNGTEAVMSVAEKLKNNGCENVAIKGNKVYTTSKKYQEIYTVQPDGSVSDPKRIFKYEDYDTKGSGITFDDLIEKAPGLRIPLINVDGKVTGQQKFVQGILYSKEAGGNWEKTSENVKTFAVGEEFNKEEREEELKAFSENLIEDISENLKNENTGNGKILGNLNWLMPDELSFVLGEVNKEFPGAYLAYDNQNEQLGIVVPNKEK